MPKYVVHISPNHMAPEYAIERWELGDDIELSSWSATDDEALGRDLRDAEAIMTWRVPFRARVIEQLEACRLIIRNGVGFDTIDLDAAKARGISIARTGSALLSRGCGQPISAPGEAFVSACSTSLLGAWQ